MATWTNFKNLTGNNVVKTRTPDPTGAAGLVINDNFKAIANALETQSADIAGKASSIHTHTTSDVTDFPTLATVAETGSYNDLTDQPTIPTAYTLPTATSSVLGGVKVGTNLSISSGVLSATNTTYSEATTSANGLMSAEDKTKLDGITGSGGTQVYGSHQALITKANIGSPSVNDDDRGYLSVDFQAERADSSNFVKGDYSFLHGRNSGISAQDGYAFGTGTAFDVEGAIQTNQNKAGVHGWKGHTGVLGLCFAPNVPSDPGFAVEIFTLGTGAIALFDVDIIAVSDGQVLLYKLALSVYKGSVEVDYNDFPTIWQWTPDFYLSDNKLYLTGGNADVVQVGIRYTILGASTSDDGASSNGGEE